MFLPATEERWNIEPSAYVPSLFRLIVKGLDAQRQGSMRLQVRELVIGHCFNFGGRLPNALALPLLNFLS